MPFFLPAVLLILSWGVLSFGAVYPWAYVPLLVGCTELGLYGLLRGRAFPGVPVVLVGSLGAIAVAISLQLVPLPPRALAWVSPASEAFVASAPPAAVAPGGEGAEASPPSGQLDAARPVSLNSRGTAQGLVFFAVFAVFFLGCARVVGVAGVDGVARGLIVLGTLVALIGVVHVAAPGGQIYGFWDTRPGAFAPLANKNHLAGWMIRVLSLSIGYFCAGVADSARRVTSGWRNRTLWLSSREAGQLLLVAVSVVLMALSLVLTLSKSGITCLALALVALGWLAMRRNAAVSRRLFATGYVVFVLIVAVGWAGIDAVGQEFFGASWSDASGRLEIWRDTAHIVEDFSLTGTGLGTYATAILGYQNYELDGRWLEAHNDYLQLAAEGGLLLGVPIVIAMFFFVREVRRRFRERADDTQTYWLRAGAVTGLIAIAAQEVVDFSLQVPGNVALCAVLAAIAIHQPHRSQGDGRRQRPDDRPVLD